MTDVYLCLVSDSCICLRCTRKCFMLFLFSRAPFSFFSGGHQVPLMSQLNCIISITLTIRLLGKLSKGKQTYAKHMGEEKKIFFPLCHYFPLTIFYSITIKTERWKRDQNATMTKSIWQGWSQWWMSIFKNPISAFKQCVHTVCIYL